VAEKNNNNCMCIGTYSISPQVSETNFDTCISSAKRASLSHSAELQIFSEHPENTLD